MEGLYPTKEQRELRKQSLQKQKEALEAEAEHIDLNNQTQVMSIQKHIICLELEARILADLDKLERYLAL